MSTKLEEFFNIPSAKLPDISDTSIDDLESELEEQISSLEESLESVVDDLPEADREFDAIAKMATERFNEISDLGMQVEANHAGKILGAASTLLGLALNAKAAKVNKKLKVMELRMRELQSKTKKSKPENVVSLGDKVSEESKDQPPAFTFDRTEALRKIMQETK